MSLPEHSELAAELAAQIMADQGSRFIDRPPGLFELAQADIDAENPPPDWEQPPKSQRGLVESLVRAGVLAGIEAGKGLGATHDE